MPTWSSAPLLYVALTRAKKTATVTGWGTLSPLIGVQG